MKEITLLFIFLLSLNFLGLAQLTDKEITFQKTVITGKVKQYQPDRNQQEIRVYLARPEESRAEITRKIKFAFEIDRGDCFPHP